MNNEMFPSMNHEHYEEVLLLTNGYCDDILTEAQAVRLSELLHSSRSARQLFVELTQLHGQLSWDAGHFGTAAAMKPAAADVAPAFAHADRKPDESRGSLLFGQSTKKTTTASTVAVPVTNPAVRSLTLENLTSRNLASRNLTVAAAAVVLLAVSVVLSQSPVGLQISQNGTTDPITKELAGNGPTGNGAAAMVVGSGPPTGNAAGHSNGGDIPASQMANLSDAELVAADGSSIQPLKLDAIDGGVRSMSDRPNESKQPAMEIAAATDVEELAIPESDDQIVDVMNRLLARSWAENEVPVAADASSEEWLRRAWLTFSGSIPPAAVVRSFASSSSPREKQRMIQQLVSSNQTSENLAAIWVNLMIGRSNPGRVDEVALFDFMRDQFAGNEPWLDTVGQLMSARGRSDRNGATNFLLAHLNNEATPATAVTAKLFLGQQVQCTQCHDHPFSREIRQDEFWALNAFFKQTRREAVVVELADGNQQKVWQLSDSEKGGMTFYETQRGQQVAVLPEFAGQRLTAEDGINRREELVKLVRHDPELRVAKAMVNRMWGHFFGAGFTNPIDDMGPHTPVSHPELLKFLTQAFAHHHYDLRRLMTWIAMSDAWQKTSVVSGASTNSMVDFLPEAGGTPVFNQVYAQHMMPEQVYNSLRTAVHSIARQPLESSLGTSHRREWVGQFVAAWGTDENDECLQFDGNISQALLMMNGDDLQQDIALAVQHLRKTLSRDQLAVSKFLPELSLATVSRMPTESEEKVFQNRLRQLSRTLGPEQALQITAEDMLWAYLNSSEFITVH